MKYACAESEAAVHVFAAVKLVTLLKFLLKGMADKTDRAGTSTGAPSGAGTSTGAGKSTGAPSGKSQATEADPPPFTPEQLAWIDRLIVSRLTAD